MGQINKVSAYIYFVLLLVFTSFEFFFRSNYLFSSLSICAIIDCCLSKEKIKINYSISCFILAIVSISILQVAFKDNLNIYGVIASIINLIGILCISNKIRNNFVDVYINTITFIAVYSLVIYIFCLHPDVYDYLYNNVADNNSLNVEKAVEEGGGRNFIIYNFQSNFINQLIGVSRNCGPFWEPGMFAVFLNIALFCNIFIKKNGKKIQNIILLLALISTFSTGGYIVSFLIVLFYIINHGLSLRNILLIIPLTLILIPSVLELEYIGEKTISQFEGASKGSGSSRFGAFITQIDMIDSSPLIGGERIEDYTTSRTLASGTLLPFVSYGIPVGIMFFVYLMTACNQITKHYHVKKIVGLEMFTLIVALSFSQTILLSQFIFLLIFIGDINLKRNNYV